MKIKQTLQDIPFIEDRCFFSIFRSPPKSSITVYSYNIENDPSFQYLPFFSDFGPLSLLQIHRFVKMTNKILNDRSGPVVFWSSFDTQMISNAVLLASSYRVIMFQMPPEEAYAPFTHLTLYLKPYRDASSFPSTYDLSVFSCLRGLYKAIEKGWYNYEMFNEEDWAKYEQVENGDMNWLIPGKLLAFASPYSTNIIRGGWKVCTPIDIVPVFRDKKINHVVRLCEKFYDEKAFIENGFNHTELFFIDGSVPPKDIVTEWLKIAEGESVIALHCKAGLGRTYVFYI